MKRNKVCLLLSCFLVLTLFMMSCNEAADIQDKTNSKIVFHSNRDGNDEIYVMNVDDSEQIRLTNNDAWDGNPSW